MTHSLLEQVPRDVTEENLRPLFEPYGDIEHINILRTHRGVSAGGGPGRDTWDGDIIFTKVCHSYERSQSSS